MTDMRDTEPDCVVVHPGVQHSGDLALALSGRERLQFLITQLQIGDDAHKPWTFPPLQRRLWRRRVHGLPDKAVVRVGTWWELIRRLATRASSNRDHPRFERYLLLRFQRLAARKINSRTRVVVGTDAASAELFRAVKATRPDVMCVLDVSHPIESAVQRLLAEDAAKHALDLAAYDDYRPHENLQDRRDELQLADRIIVASQFTASGIIAFGIPAERVKLVPYGTSIPSFAHPGSRRDDVLRLLFVGALSERKGLSILLAAMTELAADRALVTLDIVGKQSAGYQLPSVLPPNVNYHGSVERDELNTLMTQCHASILPSMCEGFGRTILEALASGMAVVTTERTGAPDVLMRAPRAPVFIIPVDDRENLAAFIQRHFDQLIGVDPRAAHDAALKFTATSYAEELERALLVTTKELP